MGNATGTYTQKATISPQLYPFSKWDRKEIQQLFIRGQTDLSESFGLRKPEVEFLIGVNEEISFQLLRSLFEDILDTDKNSLVDKFEVMCVICMVSKLATADKLNFFFDLFNFNNKGFLNESELTLLIMAVSRGVFKVDQKFIPPTARVIRELVNEAFSFALTEPGTLRKPELLRFTVSNPQIYAYLECWRGHASQVLLLDETKWRDLSFPCDESAISWSYSWGILGLPPSSYIHWRRIENIGNEIAASHLFAHEISFLKTIDRRKVFTGEGIIGKGYLKQGCLSDLWFLNGLSALISHPELVFACFGKTGQEENGRYCCRFYEGGGWRSVYIDDRMPCSYDLSPVFASSSCHYEYWPLVIEKAFAKYLGSYGHIAWCSDRSDASLTSLRMLTGGHVKKYYVPNYDWRSVIHESTKESGTQLVLEALKKGHIVCFTRSAAQAMMGVTVKQNKSSMNLLPVGRFFPVLGHCTSSAGFIYLIFKDTWGLVADAEEEVNMETGRCTTFQIKIEHLTNFFDCMVICYYPDSLRAKSSSLGYAPWITESAVDDCNKSRNTIAKYVLKVQKTPITETLDSPGKNRFKKQYEIVNDALNEANELPNLEINSIPVPRLKDKADFVRETDRPMPGGMKKNENESDKNLEKKKDPKPVNSFQPDQIDELSDVISLAFTASSSFDWTSSGAQDAGATLKIRIVPSQATKQFLRQREEDLVLRRKLKNDYLKKRRMAQAQLLEVNTFGEVDVNTVDKTSLASSSQNSLAGTGIELAEDSASLLYRNPSVSEDKQYELYFSAQRSWMSQQIQLVEGEYLVLVSLEFSRPLKEIQKRALPRDLNEAPWVDYRLATYLTRENIVDDFHPEKFQEKLFDQDDDTRSLQSLKELEKRLFSQKQRAGDLAVSQSVKDNSVPGSPTSITKNTASFTSPVQQVIPPDLESMVENKIFFECSSNDYLKLRPFNRIKKRDKYKFEVSEPIFPDAVQRETWPITCEAQTEVASAKLSEIMTDLKLEAQFLAEEFVSVARRFKEEKKQETINASNNSKKKIAAK